ncbi:hypothetical protein, partial [Pseudomonas sp.]|uniref:hypothetical protein n=1 Tax=Pseudomonas sp. TaxID=306 RepID=UPI003CC50728
MTTTPSFKAHAATSRQLRREQLALSTRSGVNAELVPLTITAALPDAEGIETNLLPVSALTTDLEVVIPTIWPGSGDPVDVGATESIMFFLDNATQPFHTETLTIPFPPNPFPLGVLLPFQSFQSPGTHELYYRVINSSELSQTSARITFTVDITAPPSGNHPVAVTVPVALIDKPYLEAEGGVTCTIPDYSDKRPGDRAYGYLAANGEEPSGPFIAEDFLAVGETRALELFFPKDEIEKFNDGDLHIRYFLKDRAGNEGLFSVDKRVELLLMDPPTLVAPVVPLAIAPDNTIDREDAQFPGGVTVQVPEYNPRSNGRDTVYVEWASQVLDAIPITAGITFPLDVRVPFSVLANPNFGPRDDDVTYRIHRGSRDYTSPARTVTVDLALPGPENPDPGPENPNLDPARLFGRGASPELNKIRVADKGLAADVKVKLYANPVAGDTLQLVYNGVAVPAPEGVKQLDGTETPGDDLDLVIPWAIIESVGDGDFELYYTLSNSAVSNSQQSPAAQVEVDMFELGTINPPVFSDRTSGGNVNCTHNIWEGVR